MLTARTSFQTKNASGYLQQLCKHFGHKVDTRYDAEKGQVEFSTGRAELTAFSDRLEFAVRSGDVEGLGTIKSVLENHLIRFAHREQVSGLEWKEWI